ncbi:MAG: hypothetical protein SFY80_08595 [Verrucomicrobiota bacterium]|nr:hypothetical protein [Verrucomicrobiota bacterium]
MKSKTGKGVDERSSWAVNSVPKDWQPTIGTARRKTHQTGPTILDLKQLPHLTVRPSTLPMHEPQFLVGALRRKQDVIRFVRTGIHSAPTQRPGGFSVFVFPYFNQQLHNVFGLE